ncbi:unnamed protein product [Acanthoscelides obtectus]|uniref:Uncharacterized protein n=1 Tax=Acanthoscelides obtectus TaxID=200917 RepID=A0A9P0JVF2_ACAOB|nr:unnamed protein product [Acanthoscelides obtectus]CAK1666046.1 hypothetical protein AOBTE_LOCUS25126 [Acanthoscelides obtectus]
MVIPAESTSTEKAKKHVGNNLQIHLSHNDKSLQVTGNNSKVKIEENSGTVRIIGDNCELTVMQGKGRIQYIGNCGKIYLGRNGLLKKLSYIGNNGKILRLENGDEEKGPPERDQKQHSDGSERETQKSQQRKIKVGRYYTRISSPSKSECKKSPSPKEVTSLSDSECEKISSMKKVTTSSDSGRKKLEAASTKHSGRRRMNFSVGCHDNFISLCGRNVEISGMKIVSRSMSG